jgi:cyclophilin family peptidyl-prolyl cis-trans isomerase
VGDRAREPVAAVAHGDLAAARRLVGELGRVAERQGALDAERDAEPRQRGLHAGQRACGPAAARVGVDDQAEPPHREEPRTSALYPAAPMRHPRVILVALLAVLAVAGCGDDEASTGGEGTETAAQTAPTQTDGPASGCESVEAPEPKEVEKRKRPAFKVDESKDYTAVLATSCGTVEIELAVKEAPKTASSFVALAREDFFDGLAFHRIVPGFVVQGGDPAGTGEGGPGYQVVEAPPNDLKYERGVVAMAKTELDKPGTSGSQFFIVTADDAGLPPDYALLGRVSKGDDVLERLGNVPADPADGTPAEPVLIEDIEIREG